MLLHNFIELIIALVVFQFLIEHRLHYIYTQQGIHTLSALDINYYSPVFIETEASMVSMFVIIIIIIILYKIKFLLFAESASWKVGIFLLLHSFR